MSLDRTHVEERQLAAIHVFTGVRTRWRTWSPMSLDRTHVEERQLAANYVCLLVSELGGGHGRQCH